MLNEKGDADAVILVATKDYAFLGNIYPGYFVMD